MAIFTKMLSPQVIRAHVAAISTHVLLTPILSASVVMLIATSIMQAAIIGIIVIAIYLSVQSIGEFVKHYLSPSSWLSLTIVLTASVSAFIGLIIKMYLPDLSQTIDNAIPIIALSSLIFSFSGAFTGYHAPFKIGNALKTSALFLAIMLIVGGINQFTNLNITFSSGLFFVLALIALYNNPTLSNIKMPDNKPNRRVRTTGTIK